MHWHKDENASAQNFYPSKGRKGKMMTGKVGRSELMAAKQGKHVRNFIKWYTIRHKVEPTQTQINDLILTGRLGNELHRLSGGNILVTLESETPRTMDGSQCMSEYLIRSAAEQREDEAKKAQARAAQAITAAVDGELLKLRFNCPIPREVIHKVQKGILSHETVSDALDIPLERVRQLIGAFDGVDMS